METLEVPALKTDFSAAGEIVSAGLKSFEERKATLTELAAESQGLTIAGVDDRAGYLNVSTSRKRLKVARVAIENEAKMLRNHVGVITKNISAKEKELLAIIEPREAELQAEEDRIDAEKERIKEEKAAAERSRIQARIDTLAGFGFAIEYTTIISIDDATFERVVADAKAAHALEEERKAEETRLQEEAAAKLAQDLADLKLLRERDAAAQKIIDDNNARIAAEQAAKDEELRLEAERLAEQQAETARLERARLQAIEDQRQAAELEAETLRLAQVEKERQLALRPDKEKLQAFAQRIGSVIDFQVKDEKAMLILNDITIMIGKMQAHIIKKVKDL